MTGRKGGKPSRRAFLISAGMTGAAATGAALAGTDPAHKRAPGVLTRRRNLKIATTWPKNFPGIGVGVERFAKRVADMSDGAMEVRVFAAGELVPALGVFDAVSEGKVDMYHGAEYYWQGKNPAFNFFAAVPFGLTANEMNAWIYHGGGQELWDELSARFNIKAMPAGNTGVQMGGWYKRRIRNLEDLKGLRIRMPGLGGRVMSRLGATPVTKAGGEIFLALSQGNIDATEWIGPWNDMAFGFHTIAPYYYGPGFQEPGATLSLGINKQLWDDLTPGQRAIIENAALAENMYMLAEYNAMNARALQRLKEEHGIIPQPFPDDVMNAAARAAGDVVAEVAAADPFAAKVAENYLKARRIEAAWSAIADQGYMNARQRAAEG